MDIPKSRRKKKHSKLDLHSIHTIQKFLSKLPMGMAEANPRSNGKDEKQIASLPFTLYNWAGL
jgi:hypothetical protein